MNKIKFVKKFGRGLIKSELDQIDEKVGQFVPVEIKQLLAIANGGYPAATVFPILGMKDNDFGSIRYFYGVDQTPDKDLWFSLDCFSGRMPAALFPFACLDGSDQVCLVTGGKRKGQIVLWDFYGETAKPTWKNVYKIANSFDEFLNSLTVYVESDD
jgi:SMI1 / KNR4 family (SUKH-1)